MFIASEIPKIGENSENPDVSTVSEEILNRADMLKKPLG